MRKYTYKYQVTMWWSEKDQAFIAMAPQLPGCIHDGPTVDAALAELQQGIDIWMELAKEKKWPIPEPAGQILPVRNEFDWQEASQEKPVKNKPVVSTKKSESRVMDISDLGAKLRPKVKKPIATRAAVKPKRSTHA